MKRPGTNACPFCGSDESHMLGTSHGEGFITHAIICGRCEATGPASRLDEDDAVALWNGANARDPGECVAG